MRATRQIRAPRHVIIIAVAVLGVGLCVRHAAAIEPTLCGNGQLDGGDPWAEGVVAQASACKHEFFREKRVFQGGKIADGIWTGCRGGGGRVYSNTTSQTEASQLFDRPGVFSASAAARTESIPFHFVHHTQQRLPGDETAEVLAPQAPLAIFSCLRRLSAQVRADGHVRHLP